MDIQGLINAILAALEKIATMPQLQAVLAGLGCGVGVTYALAKFMPNNMDTSKAKRITALVAFGTTLNISLLLSPTVQTFAWAFFFGLTAPAIHGALVRYLIHKWPWAAPEAVMDGADTEQADRRKRQIVRDLGD